MKAPLPTNAHLVTTRFDGMGLTNRSCIPAPEVDNISGELNYQLAPGSRL